MKNKWVNYVIVLSQTFFTLAVTLAFLLNDKILDFKILIVGYILLAISYLTLIIPSIINKLK